MVLVGYSDEEQIAADVSGKDISTPNSSLNRSFVHWDAIRNCAHCRVVHLFARSMNDLETYSMDKEAVRSLSF